MYTYIYMYAYLVDPRSDLSLSRSRTGDNPKRGQWEWRIDPNSGPEADCFFTLGALVSSSYEWFPQLGVLFVRALVIRGQPFWELNRAPDYCLEAAIYVDSKK